MMTMGKEVVLRGAVWAWAWRKLSIFNIMPKTFPCQEKAAYSPPPTHSSLLSLPSFLNGSDYLGRNIKALLLSPHFLEWSSCTWQPTHFNVANRPQIPYNINVTTNRKVPISQLTFSTRLLKYAFNLWKLVYHNSCRPWSLLINLLL